MQRSDIELGADINPLTRELFSTGHNDQVDFDLETSLPTPINQIYRIRPEYLKPAMILPALQKSITLRDIISLDK